MWSLDGLGLDWSLDGLGVKLRVQFYTFTSAICIAPCFPGPNTVLLRKEPLASAADRHLLETWHGTAAHTKQAKPKNKA